MRYVLIILILTCILLVSCDLDRSAGDIDFDKPAGQIGKDEPAACTEDARLCPDGSSVARVPPDCEFAECPETEMTIEEALAIAENSECTEKGTLTENNFYNPNSKTWWIDLDMNPEFEKDGCNPACVVFAETEAVEINWRCTGLG